MNGKRREQQNTLWWLEAYERVAAEHGQFGNGRYVKRTPVKYRGPEGGRFELGPEHSCAWHALVAPAKDTSFDRTDVWYSLPSIAYYAGISQNELDDVLKDLETVGLIRRESRPKKQTTITHLFISPIEPGEDWKLREPMQLFKFMEESEGDYHHKSAFDRPTAAKPAAQQVTEGQTDSIMLAILLAFDMPPCLSTKEDQDRLIRLFPQFAGIMGSAMRLLALFMCIHQDKSAQGMDIKNKWPNVKNAGAYIRTCLEPWSLLYSNAITSFLASLQKADDEETEGNDLTSARLDT